MLRLMGVRGACVVLAAAFAMSACGDAEPRATSAPGEAARWEFDPDRPPDRASDSVSALVSRMECANGITGRVLAPVIREDDKRVVITFRVERNPDGDASCPGNNLVQRTVELDAPLGDRLLYDGTCLPRRDSASECEPRQVWPSKQ